MSRRRFRYNEEAERELVASAEWYEERRPGLGGEFVEEVDRKLAAVLDAPHRWPIERGVRRMLFDRFPYAIVYRELSDETLEVIAVAHLNRRQAYWRGR